MIDLDRLETQMRKAIGTGENIPYVPVSPTAVLELIGLVKKQAELLERADPFVKHAGLHGNFEAGAEQWRADYAALKETV